MIFGPVLYVILSGFHLAQRMVTGCFSSQVLGVKGMWSTGSERGRAMLMRHRQIWSSGQTGDFVLSVGREVSAS